MFERLKEQKQIVRTLWNDYEKEKEPRQASDKLYLFLDALDELLKIQKFLTFKAKLHE